MRIVGLIPARAGSKRVPGKCTARVGGQPLIGWTCAAARASGVLAALYVNTDCPRIAAEANGCGVATPFLRPARLATDDAPSRDANRFFLNVLAERGEAYDAVAILQPTSPLRTAEDIRAAVQLFRENAPCAVVSVTPVAPANWLGTLGRDGRFEPYDGDLSVYRLNGAIYLYLLSDYLAGRAPRKTLALPLPPERGVDIDTPEDLLHAEALLARDAALACA